MSGLLNEVADYYSAKLAEHGTTPQGVDWNGPESQTVRFTQLAKIIEPGRSFSLSDVGCGYGALYDFLARSYQDFSYHGIDIAETMVEAAKKNHPAKNATFSVNSAPPASDYCVASGIFNVRQKRSDREWLDYVIATLDAMERSSIRGFAANFLTAYSDADKQRDYLYYADPCALFDHCKRRYSRHVSLLHDYGLYEFTLLVRKEI